MIDITVPAGIFRLLAALLQRDELVAQVDAALDDRQC
jgi:hypothetical protein